MLTGVLRRALFAASRSRPLARRLFGIEFGPAAPGERYFDLTTLPLVLAAARRLRPGRRMLDMGTGLFATVGLSVARRTGCDVLCSDVDPRIVARAREAVALNGAAVTVRESDLFASVGDGFDLVTFNPPYVATSARLGGEAFSGQSDGGADGTAVVSRFLDAFTAVPVAARACLGVSTWHVTHARLAALVEPCTGVEVETVEVSRFPPVEVWVLRRR